MSLIQNPALSVVKPPHKKIEACPYVGDVWNRDEKFTTCGLKFHQLFQSGIRRGHMFENITHNDGVIAAQSFQRRVIEWTRPQLLVIGRGGVSPIRYCFDAEKAQGCIPVSSRQHSGRSPNIQHFA